MGYTTLVQVISSTQPTFNYKYLTGHDINHPKALQVSQKRAYPMASKL
ncbi:MAG: hypothetical protein QNJ63_28065 [Calothrix sp. MO_192.B10]|nr:hypothetical protein [Calothrix sp. MO_192.B10]